MSASAPSGPGPGTERGGRTGSGFRISDPGRHVILALTLGRLRASLAKQLAADGFHVIPMDDAGSLADRLRERPAGVVIASSELPGIEALDPAVLAGTPLLLVVSERATPLAPELASRALGVLYEPVDTDDVRTIVWNTVN